MVGFLSIEPLSYVQPNPPGMKHALRVHDSLLPLLCHWAKKKRTSEDDYLKFFDNIRIPKTCSFALEQECLEVNAGMLCTVNIGLNKQSLSCKDPNKADMLLLPLYNTFHNSPVSNKS